MMRANLEHTNITVSDPDKTARLLCELFDWRIRWSGAANDNGYTVHVGNENNYIALYRPARAPEIGEQKSDALLNLNHIGVTVTDLERAQTGVREAGLTAYNHDDYEPGKRFYFNADDGLEIEVVSYNPSSSSYWSLVSQHK